MQSNFKQVRRWMQLAQQPCPETFTPITHQALDLRRTLVNEEVSEFNSELATAVDNLDHISAAKEAADILVTVYGFFADIGIDADEAFAIVQEANFQKLEHQQVRADGKIIVPQDIKLALKSITHKRLAQLLRGNDHGPNDPN